MNTVRLRVYDAQTNEPARLPSLPALIHGSEASNAALLAAALIQAAIQAEEAVVVLSVRKKDIRVLGEQLRLTKPAATGSQVDVPTMTVAEHHLLVTLVFKEPDQLLAALRSMTDWSERFVVILGSQETLTPGIWQVVKSAPRLLVCGDFTHARTHIAPDFFQTQIGFSDWPKEWKLQRPAHPSYVGVDAQSQKEYIVLV
jgi:hypothetical protein